MAKGKGAESASSTGLLQPGLLKQDELRHAKKESKEKLSVCNKLCYAVGGAPYQITGCALGFFLQIYLLDVAQLDPFYASIILFVGRAWDAITDPMVGFFISKTPWSRLGRLMPWIIFSTPFAVISYFLVWFVPDISSGQVMWYLLFYCTFQTLVTCFHVPYSALTMFISREQSERDSATAYRMTVEVLGTVLGTAIQGQIVGQVDTPCIQDSRLFSVTNSSVAVEEVNVTRDAGSLTDTHSIASVPPQSVARAPSGSAGARMTLAAPLSRAPQETQVEGAWWSGLANWIRIGIYILCAVVLFLGVREKRDASQLQSDEPISFFQGLKLVMKHGAYIKLITGFLFTSLAFMLLEGNFALFCTYTLGFRNEFQNILLAIMSAIPFLIMVVVLESNLIVTYVVAIAAGISVAAAFLLPWSMLPDVIDDFNLQHPDAHGHEAIFFSFYVFFTKFTSGVSLGISTLSLDFAGYKTRGCSQPEEVKFTLKMLVSAAPVGLILLGLLLFKLYPIDEDKRRENKKALQDLREEENSSDSDSMELASIV
ncbi:Major facilitator superfamily domain-containing protein 2A [Chelonia mydas]|uniref:Major facilitator superfamily domain-containing protein 2A n=1 Tax=Chelonia mydas TaxID=8469 RepID=M7AUP7_CHEMY|nr:Major facilitator superfamily domain-containing protein 2A [Chelonia mydas]